MHQNIDRSVKPSIAPKPRTKPNVPPKPTNLHKPVVPKYKASPIKQIKIVNKKIHTLKSTQIKTYHGDFGDNEKSFENEEISLQPECDLPCLYANSNSGSDSLDNEERCNRSSGYMSNSISCLSSITNGWSDEKSSPIESIESSECSDIQQHCNFDENDILEKLSDIECSDRSYSTSPYHSPINDSSFSIANESLSSNKSNPFDVSFSNSLPTIQIDDSCKANNTVNNSKIFNIANEVMSSEAVFCDVLKLLNVDFREFVLNADCICTKTNKHSSHPLLHENELNKILNYLPQLQNFSEGLLEDLKQRLSDWDSQHKIADIIVTKGPFLKLYSSYIRDFEQQCNLLDDARNKYPKFHTAVSNFEASDKCLKLGVRHYMLKPVQRIPQYRLLFQSYIDLLSHDSPDLNDARKALGILEEVANHANDTMKIEDKVSELLSLQRRMYRCDGSEPELLKPGRELLKQGELKKLSRKGSQPRYFVLLSDVLLYISYSSSGTAMLKLNTELPLEGMKVCRPLADDFSAEMTIRATQRSFTLQARSEVERDGWVAALEAAIFGHQRRRSTFLQANTMDFSHPEEELGKQAPVWVPDYRVTMCQLCTAEFSLMFRRHHCRACGKVVCDGCSLHRVPLEYKKNAPMRVCDLCLPSLTTKLETQEAKPRQIFKRRNVRDSARFRNQRKPDRLLEVRGSDGGCEMLGYLRRGGRRGWFVLKSRVLYRHAAPEDVAADDSLSVLGYSLSDQTGSGEASFTLSHPNQEDITFTADNHELALKWVTAMREAIVL